MRKILFMMLMLFSVNSFAENPSEDESTDRDVVLKEEVVRTILQKDLVS